MSAVTTRLPRPVAVAATLAAAAAVAAVGVWLHLRMGPVTGLLVWVFVAPWGALFVADTGALLGLWEPIASDEDDVFGRDEVDVQIRGDGEEGVSAP